MDPIAREMIARLFPETILGVGPDEQVEAALVVAQIATGKRSEADLAALRAHLIGGLPRPVAPGMVGLVDGVIERARAVLSEGV